jgi:ElaB/YqjD/DUF883 family membrane-anchored ribosome-binding protein
MTSSEQLERRAEQTRAQIADTLDELRRRMSPGRVLDETLDYVRDYVSDGGGEFVRNFGRQVARNPLPVALMGTGIAWLVMANEFSRRRRDDWELGESEHVAADRSAFDNDYTREVSKTASQASERASEFADRTGRRMRRTRESARRGVEEIGDRVQSAASRLGEQAQAARSRIQEGVSSATEAAWDAYEQTLSAYEESSSRARRAAANISHTASTAATSAARQGRTFIAYVRDEPLVLAGIGITLGAIIGAALPRSRFEDELMGETSEDLKERATGTAKEQWEKGKTALAETWETAKDEAEELANSGAETDKQQAAEEAETRLSSEPPEHTPLVPSEHETDETKIR